VSIRNTRLTFGMIICEGGRGERIKGVSTATPYWMLTNRPAYGWVNDN
jgi:hypothetical protein